MLCFIFGAFHTVRTIAQFGSALDWGSRGRGFKSRWSDQENPSFRRLRGIGTAGFSASRGGQGRCTTDLRPGACDTDALPFPSCAGSVLLGTRRSGRMARPSRSKNPSKLIYVGGYIAGGAWIAFVSYQYMKHCLRSFPATNAYRRRKPSYAPLSGLRNPDRHHGMVSLYTPSRDGHGGDHDYRGHDTAYSAPRRNEGSTRLMTNWPMPDTASMPPST